MKENKYSIVIPIYNCERFIDRCIKSIINQSYKNIELILINDGSTDNSNIICKKYSENDNRIVYIEQKNSGVSSARNKGIEKATGDYITFVDSDDYIEKNTLELLNKIIEKEKCDIIKYGYVKESRFLKKTYEFSIEKNININRESYNEKVYPYIFQTYDLSNIWNAIYKKEVISNIRFDEDLKYGEDFKFMIQALLQSKSLYIESRCLYHYVYNSNSAINKNNMKNKQEKLINIITCCLDIQKELGVFECLEEQINMRIKNTIMVFCAEIAKNNNYDFYLGKIQEIIKHESFRKIEKRYLEDFNLDIWNGVLEHNYYQKLKKYNLKIKLKKIILKLIGGEF